MAASGPTATAANRRFTAESLPLAIGNLFKINNYDVEYDFHLHGAQVDLVAKAKGDPLSSAIFIEATVEYVSNDKYAKDITKFALIQRKDPAARCLLISSLGFTGSVKERPRETGIILFTYDELFSKFERFSPYVDSVLGDKDTKKLVDTYEEPRSHDSKGTDYATKWLAHWKGLQWTQRVAQYPVEVRYFFQL